jgi:hypothetical protein
MAILKVYNDVSCFQEISGIIGDEPIEVGTLAKRYVWIKNTSGSMTLQDIAFSVEDSDLLVTADKTSLEPFEKTRVTLTFVPKVGRETSINSDVGVSYVGIKKGKNEL